MNLSKFINEVNQETGLRKQNWFEIYFVFLRPFLSTVQMHDFAAACGYKLKDAPDEPTH